MASRHLGVLLVATSLFALFPPVLEAASLTFPDNHVSVWLNPYSGYHGESRSGSLTRSTIHGEIYACGSTDNHMDDHYHPKPNDVYDGYIRKMDNQLNHHWTRFFDTPKTTELRGCDANPEGTVFAMGYTYSHLASPPVSTNPELFLCAFDRYGTELWSRQFHTEMRPDPSYLWPMPLRYHAASNSLYGAYTIPSPVRVIIVKFDASNGNVVWQRTLQGSTSVLLDYEESKSYQPLAVDSQGAVIVAAISQGNFDATNGWGPQYNHTRVGSSGDDIIIAKFDANGNTVWRHFLASPSDEGAAALDVDEYDNVIVSGWTWGVFEGESLDHGTNRDAFIVKLNGDTGARVFVKLIDIDSGDERATAVTVDPEGFIYAAVRRPSSQIYVYMMDGDGNTIDRILQGNPHDIFVPDLDVLPDGSLAMLVQFNDGLDVYDTSDYHSHHGGALRISVDRNCSCSEVDQVLADAISMADVIEANSVLL